MKMRCVALHSPRYLSSPNAVFGMMLWTASARDLMMGLLLQASLGNLPQVEKLCRALLVAGIASAAAPGRRLRSRAFAPECQARHRVFHAVQ